MRRLFALTLAAALGAGTAYLAFEFHVVRTTERVLLVRKQQADWRDAYVDVRRWTFREWSAHPQLSRNLVAAGHGDVVARSGASDFFRGMLDSLRGE